MAQQFQEFTFTNAVRFYAGDRPGFFADTDVRQLHVVTGLPQLRRSRSEVHAASQPRRDVLRVSGGRLAILEFAIPRATAVRAVYIWYFNRVLPRIGRLVSRHNAAYGYLPASVGAFASPDEFVTILRHRGFANVRAIPLTFGIVYLYVARKP